MRRMTKFARTIAVVEREQPGPPAFKIVMVEGTQESGASIARMLKREGFEAHVVRDVETSLDLARSLPADLVLFDMPSPEMGGVEACRRLRMFSDAYVIMLTAHSTEAARLAGLAVGVDDYMTTPISPRELVAHIRAMQRRPRFPPPRARVRRFGALEIDADNQRVTLDGAAVVLSQTEYRLLNALSAEPGRILSRGELVRRLWGEAWFGSDHLLDVHISNLRRKLGDDSRDPRYIATVRGLGFRMRSG